MDEPASHGGAPAPARSIEPGALDELRSLLHSQRPRLGDAVVDFALAAIESHARALSAAPQEEVRAEPGEAARLRQVTVLFCDIVGSTSMLQTLDAEDALQLLDAPLQRFTALIERAGGRVLRYTGDGLKAAFGSERTREDDAERAVQTGLEILLAARAHGRHLQQSLGVEGFAVRLGLHTGEVVLGVGYDADRSAMGHAVHVAARMEQAAPAGGLRISEATHSLVRGRFEVGPLERLEVKGVDHPVPCRLVLRACAAGPAVHSGAGAAPLVGRGAELQVLHHAFERWLAGAGLRRCLVVGDAGVGKSRLAHEFERALAPHRASLRLLHARCTPLAQSQAFGLWRQLLAAQAGLRDDDAMELACSRLESTLAPQIGVAGAHRLGQLLGLDFRASPHVSPLLDDARQLRLAGLDAASLWLRKQPQPVLLLVDDLHWVDDDSMDLLEQLARDARAPRVFLLALARPALDERLPPAASAPWERLDLRSLDASGSAALVDALLQDLPDAPPLLRARLADGADGNPFHIQERVQMLIDRGAIDARDRPWRLAGDLWQRLEVPPSLTGVLQARLDALPAAELQALQAASVIGPEFLDATLRHVDADAAQRLALLKDRGLVHALDDDSGAGGPLRHRFRHQVLQQVTYDTVLKPLRRQAHARTADWLAHHAGALADSVLGSAAEHFDKAGEAAQALEFHARAAEQLAARSSHSGVRQHVARALELLATTRVSDSAGLRWRLLAARERMLDLLGRRDEQRADQEAMLALADAMPPGPASDRQRADLAWRTSDLAMRTSDLVTQEREARRSLELAERAGDEALVLQATHRLVISLAQGGNPAAGMEMAQAALPRARALGAPAQLARLYNALSQCANYGNDIAGLMHWTEQALPLLRAAGQRRNEALALSNLGVVHLHCGSLAQARRQFEAALVIQLELGHREGEGTTLAMLAEVAWCEGRHAQAAELARDAAEILGEVKSRRHRLVALWTLGQAELGEGKAPAAQAAFSCCEAEARQLGNAGLVVDALLGQLQVALAADDLAQAQSVAARMLAEADAAAPAGGAGTPQRFAASQEHLLRLTLVELWERCADPRAAAMRQEAHDALMQAANGISDAGLRQGFIQARREHRAIVQRCAAQSR